VYPNVFAAGRSITDAAGVRGLFTGYLPTLLEDVPVRVFSKKFKRRRAQAKGKMAGFALQRNQVYMSG